jgi:alpha-D-ribose 1-methylphosphonate 5-triphosphate synthase subunit PhnH
MTHKAKGPAAATNSDEARENELSHTLPTAPSTQDQLLSDLETLAEWKADLASRIARAELCFHSSVGLSDERREALLHEGGAWHRAANSITKRVTKRSS